jgi:hypothetical protein
MKLKTVLTAALLTFVVVSLAAAVADVAGLRGRASSGVPSPETPSGDRLIAYYFHTSTRCPTCRAIESLARESFGPAIESGAVEWRLVNYEEAANRHFVKEFELLCPSVVLVQTRDGAVIRWKNLDRVWELNDDRPAYLEYARSEWATFREVRP